MRPPIEIDPATGSLKRVLFDAALEGDAVDAWVEFAIIPGGAPSCAARTRANAPARQLAASIENREYVRQ